MLILVFGVALIAFTLSAISGGGASLLVVPLLQRALPISAVPAALSVGTGLSSLSRIAAFRRDIRWDVCAWFIPAAIPAAILGAVSLRFINPAYVQLVMALFLIGNLPYIFRREPEATHEHIAAWVLLGVGAAAGFLSGLVGAVGVLFNRFYLGYGLRKQEIVATRAMNEVLVHIVKLIVYAAMGLMRADALRTGLVVGAAAVVASYLLKPLLAHLPRAVFAKLGYSAMTLSGLALLGSAATQVIRSDQIRFDLDPIVHGAEATLYWRSASLALELGYDDGLELELGIPLSELNGAQRALVHAQAPQASAAFAESVYELGKSYYEAYYVRDGHVVKEITFDAQGKLVME